MASEQIDKVLKLYKLVAQYPSLSGAKILQSTENGVVLQSSWSQRNLERRTNQRFSQEQSLDKNLSLVSEGFPLDITSELASSVSEDQQCRAVLRQATIENSQKQFIEIWNKRHLLKNYDLASLDVHGDVYSDSQFGSFYWSPDKSKLLYIAEKKLPKPEPFYKQKPLDKKDKDKEKKEDEEETTRGTEYNYKPHWGEQLVGKHRPVVVVLDTTADTITPLAGIPDELSPGQVIWAPNGEDVVGVAWKHEPRYLGLVACTNRESWIFLLKDGVYKKLSSDGCAVVCPRFSPNGKTLVWLEREAYGPHHNAHRLVKIDWETSLEETDIVVDIVPTSITIGNNKQFHGLYGQGFPVRCWSEDSKYLFLSTSQRSNTRSYIINLETKVATEIENDKSSLRVLDVYKNTIAFLRTSLTEPPRLEVGRFHAEAANIGEILRSGVTASEEMSGFENIMYEPNEHLYDNDDDVKQFNSMYFGPKGGQDKSIPLIVMPHGGPHSAFSNIFPLDQSLFTLLGFAVLQVNYRGSTGMGSKNVEYLQGRVGNADVKDCVTATEETLRKYPWLDPARLGLYGGSHGGFLVAHLSGQHPDMFKAVVARNPVIDIAAMFTISDIPDCRNALTREEKIACWHDVCAAVIAEPYDASFPKEKSAEMFLKMLNCSPIVHVDKVKIPTLVCIGTNDLRVPFSQGKLWYHRLKANNVKSKLLVYEDNHPLASGPVEIDNVVNAALWLIEHTAGSTD